MSSKRLAWDALSLIVLAYDIISIPLVVFAFRRTTFTATCGWFATIFWTVDIVVNFFTGFIAEAQVEMRPWRIAEHYAKTWFPLDIVLVLMDLTIAALTLGSVDVVGILRILKTSRIIKMVRAARLIRLTKLKKVLSSVVTNIKSDYIRTCASILAMVLSIVVINHYLACGWWLIGTISEHHDTPNWIGHNDLQDADPRYSYMTSLHWSLTQFTPAGMEVHPYNEAERVYSVVVLLFALITFSSFVSSITSSMTHLRRLNAEPEIQEAALRQYLADHSISTELSNSIMKFMQRNHFSNKRTRASDVPALALLPASLTGKISEELYLENLARSPFYYRYCITDFQGARAVCHRATREVSLVPEQEVFACGDEAHSMYIITHGCSRYVRGGDDNSLPDIEGPLHVGMHIAEAALWLRWTYRGALEALSVCDMVVVDSVVFRNVVSEHVEGLEFARSYAHAVLQYTRSLDGEAWATDLWDADTMKTLARSAAGDDQWTSPDHHGGVDSVWGAFNPGQ